MEYIYILLLVLAGFGILALLFKVFKKPMMWMLKLLLNSILGFVGLFVFNFFGSLINLSLGLNLINATVLGVFGVPGLALLLLVKYLF